MNSIMFNVKKVFDWKSHYYIAILILIDFFAAIPYLNYNQLIRFPHAGPGVFEFWILFFSLLHKSKLVSVFAYIFALSKPILAICIIKKIYLSYYFAIVIYIIELLAGLCFIFTFRIPHDGVSLLLFVECFLSIFVISIILLLIRSIREKSKQNNNQKTIDLSKK